MTTPIISLPPAMSNDHIGAVLRALTADGQMVRFVGGCVRDAILRRPFVDIDLATPDTPQKVIELLQRARIKAVPTGIDHGTISAISGHKAYQITTLRRDVDTDGRHATVAFTDDWAMDAARRDFTMNAIYCDGAGHLFDPLGMGIEDAKAGRVRFVGHAADRIAEDYLRILRFFRFYAHYGQMDLIGAELAACREFAPHIRTLSGERVRDEFLKLLSSSRAVMVLKIMAAHQVLPEIILAEKFSTLENLIELEQTPDALRRLAALMVDNQLDAMDLMERFKLSGEQKQRLAIIQDLWQKRPIPASVKEARQAIYWLGADQFVDLTYIWAAQGAIGRDQLQQNLLTANAWQNPKLPVGGQDLIALGLGEGPKLGKYLSEIEQWWIDGDFTAGREECLAHLRQLPGLA